MPIVSTSIKDRPQGTHRVVHVYYTDHVGVVHTELMRVDNAFDIAAHVAARAISMATDLAEGELEQIDERVRAGEDPVTMPINHARRVDVLREAAKLAANADKEDLLHYAAFISSRTDVQLATILGVTQARAAVWKTRVAALASEASAYEGGRVPRQNMRRAP